MESSLGFLGIVIFGLIISSSLIIVGYRKYQVAVRGSGKPIESFQKTTGLFMLIGGILGILMLCCAICTFITTP
jgi:hypothetical protein